MTGLRDVIFTAALVCFAGLATAPAFGQRFTSPPATASVKVAGKQISVAYYAPSMRGRKIMGALVPFGQVWCPGANVATGLTTEADLQIGNLKLHKGTWSIWMIPGEKEWTLIVNKQSGQHHLDYDSSEDLGRTKVTPKMLAAPVETLKFELTADGGNKGTLALLWETTEVSIPFTVLP
jgi:hypothetical protein